MKPLVLTLLLVFSVPLTLAQDFKGHTHDINEVKFSPDGTHLISYSAGDGWLCLWEVRSGRLLWRTRTEFIQRATEHYTLTSFAFSPDQTLVASGSGNGTVQLWDAKTGKFLWLADAHTDSVTAVEFSPDGKTVVSAASPEESADKIKVIRVADGQIMKQLEGKTCVVLAMAFAENGRLLRVGNLDGSVSQWDLETGKQSDLAADWKCRQRRTYEWETSFTPDLRTLATRTSQNELTLTDTQTNTVKKKLEADAYRLYSKFSADGHKVIVSNYGGFIFYDLSTGETRKIAEFSRTGSTIDLSLDGSLFAEGGSWGKAAISITETKTGKSWLLGGGGGVQRVAPVPTTELQKRLLEEQAQRRSALATAKYNRDKQAAIDLESYQKQVHISFAHYGDMTNPGELRMMESGEPNKSKVKKSVNDANAVWLRLHNDSPLPIKIPTQSMYLSKKECFFEFPNGAKVFGLCDGQEISVWHGLDDKSGKAIPFGFDFGSSAFLLPKTSVLFAVPRAILKNGNAIRFSFTFQKDTEAKKVADYGREIELKFREADLPPLN